MTAGAMQYAPHLNPPGGLVQRSRVCSVGGYQFAFRPERGRGRPRHNVGRASSPVRFPNVGLASSPIRFPKTAWKLATEQGYPEEPPWQRPGGRFGPAGAFFMKNPG
jgi:hypothetical protein